MKLFTKEQIEQLKSRWKNPTAVEQTKFPLLELKFGDVNCPMLFVYALSPDQKTIEGLYAKNNIVRFISGYFVIEELLEQENLSLEQAKVISDFNEMFSDLFPL